MATSLSILIDYFRTDRAGVTFGHTKQLHNWSSMPTVVAAFPRHGSCRSFNPGRSET